MTVPDKHATRLKTIPNSNLAERKREVLRIHKENLQFVEKLAIMKAKQELLVPLDQQKGFTELSLELKYRSRSANSTNRPFQDSTFKARSLAQLGLK